MTTKNSSNWVSLLFLIALISGMPVQVFAEGNSNYQEQLAQTQNPRALAVANLNTTPSRSGTPIPSGVAMVDPGPLSSVTNRRESSNDLAANARVYGSQGRVPSAPPAVISVDLTNDNPNTAPTSPSPIRPQILPDTKTFPSASIFSYVTGIPRQVVSVLFGRRTNEAVISAIGAGTPTGKN
jgi:hypothetical protein